MTGVLQPGQGWQLVGEGYAFTEAPAVNAKGEVFFADIPNNRVYRVALDGTVSVFKENSGGASGLMFGRDGRLYACQTSTRRIVTWETDGRESVFAEGIEPNDLVVTYSGNVYVTDPAHKQVWLVTRNGGTRVVDTGIAQPNGIILSPDRRSSTSPTRPDSSSTPSASRRMAPSPTRRRSITCTCRKARPAAMRMA